MSTSVLPEATDRAITGYYVFDGAEATDYSVTYNKTMSAASLGVARFLRRDCLTQSLHGSRDRVLLA